MKRSAPRISIVIPNFQGARYLEQSIRSVLNQDYSNVELIVVDGGSTDGSQEILEMHGNSIAYWVSEPDNGQSHAINKGFRRATGEIVTFTGSDDEYAPAAFADVVHQFGKNPGAGAVIGAFQLRNPGSDSTSEPVAPRLSRPAPLDLTLLNPADYRLHQVSTFYRKSALMNVGFYVREDLRYVMDRELLYRVCREYPIALGQRVYGVFRQHHASKSESFIVEFSKEFAGLYLERMTGEPREDRMRRRNARYLVASGLIRSARRAPSLWRATTALLMAAFVSPGQVITYNYLSAWRGVLRGGDRGAVSD